MTVEQMTVGEQVKVNEGSGVVWAVLTEVSGVVVGGTVESEVSQVGNQTGDLPSVDTLTLTQNIELQHTDNKL